MLSDPLMLVGVDTGTDENAAPLVIHVPADITSDECAEYCEE